METWDREVERTNLLLKIIKLIPAGKFWDLVQKQSSNIAHLWEAEEEARIKCVIVLKNFIQFAMESLRKF